MAYCENEQCEYNEDGVCEYEGTLALDVNGQCKRFRYKTEQCTVNEDAEE